MSYYLQVVIGNFICGALVWLELFSLVNFYNGVVKRECQDLFEWFSYRVWGKQALLHAAGWLIQSVLILVITKFLVSLGKFGTDVAPGLIVGIILGVRTFVKEINKRAPKQK